MKKSQVSETSAGATSSGAVAPVSQALSTVQKRTNPSIYKDDKVGSMFKGKKTSKPFANSISEDQQLDELDNSTMKSYLEKRRSSTTPTSIHKAGTQSHGMRSAKEKIHDKEYTDSARAMGDPRIQESELDEKALSKQQQKFFGMAHAIQQGEKVKGASPELKKVAKSMSKQDVKDFASTKHKGLPKKVSEGFRTVEVTKGQIHEYYLKKYLSFESEKFPQRMISSITHLNEENEHEDIKHFIDKISDLDLRGKINVGDSLAVLDFDVNFAWQEITGRGFTSVKKVTKVSTHPDGSVNYVMFEDGTRYPRQTKAVYGPTKRPLDYSAYFKDSSAAEQALLVLQLVVPDSWEFDTTEIDSSGKKVSESIPPSDLDVTVDPELKKTIGYAQAHYPASKNTSDAFHKYVQRSIKHAKEDDTIQNIKLKKLAAEIQALQSTIAGNKMTKKVAESEIYEDDLIQVPGGRRLKPGLLHKAVSSSNPTDTVKVDIPLLIRLFEYAREDAQTDMDLHDLAEKLIALSDRGRTLTMRDYEKLVPTPQPEEETPAVEGRYDYVDYFNPTKKPAERIKPGGKIASGEGPTHQSPAEYERAKSAAKKPPVKESAILSGLHRGHINVTETLSVSEFKWLDDLADRLFNQLGIDVEFTKHFFDRANDERSEYRDQQGKTHEQGITAEELAKVFTAAYKTAKEQNPKYVKVTDIAPGAEANIKDHFTKLNIPFVMKKVGKDRVMVPKTVMRKDNFTNPPGTKSVPVNSKGM